MTAIDGQAAIDEFKKRYRDGIEYLRMINSTVLCYDPPQAEWSHDPLLEFANDFIKTNSYEAQNIAIALASLQVFIYVESKDGQTFPDCKTPPYFKLKEGESGEFQSIFFTGFIEDWDNGCTIEEGTRWETLTCRKLFYDPNTRVENDHYRDDYNKEHREELGAVDFRTLQSDGTDSDGIRYVRLKCFSSTNMFRLLSKMHIGYGIAIKESMWYVKV